MAKPKIKAILTDIEGTTSSISFVHEVLFPYAKEHIIDFVYDNESDIEDLLDDVRAEEVNPDLSLEEVIEVLQRYIEEDQKVTPLKELQGRVWEAGYKSGELVGHVYEDAVHGLKRWKEEGLTLYVYSSGSVAAQKLIFGHTEFGDLTPLFSGYFDTNIGSKKEADSYSGIAIETGMKAENILFLSDSTEEIDAAKAAGMQAITLDREKSLFNNGEYTVVENFDDILPEMAKA